MEEITINGNTWQKYKGDEGQDVFIAKFMIDQDKLLGKYVDESFYDVLIENDADVYLPPECDMTQQQDCDNVCINCMSESELAFKFRRTYLLPKNNLVLLRGYMTQQLNLTIVVWQQVRELNSQETVIG